MILSALRPLTCNSTWPQHTLQMFADHYGPRQTIPWETINQGLLQPQGELYPIQTIFNHRSRDQLLEFRTSFYQTISSAFLVQGNFKHTQFSREHWNWPDSNSQPLAPKASAVSIELTWLLWYGIHAAISRATMNQFMSNLVCEGFSSCFTEILSWKCWNAKKKIWWCHTSVLSMS